jgi:hypothetical protein
MQFMQAQEKDKSIVRRVQEKAVQEMLRTAS